MYDINFFQKSNNLKDKITHSLLTKKDCADISAEFEIIRSKKPKIYNIETTNYCNMKCVMCPRTIFMERKNIYSLANHKVSCDNLSINQISNKIIKLYEEI